MRELVGNLGRVLPDVASFLEFVLVNDGSRDRSGDRLGLWSKFDRYSGHYRRYTRDGLIGALKQAGLEVVRIRPLFR
jgi:hypothetical protein